MQMRAAVIVKRLDAVLRQYPLCLWYFTVVLEYLNKQLLSSLLFLLFFEKLGPFLLKVVQPLTDILLFFDR